MAKTTTLRTTSHREITSIERGGRTAVLVAGSALVVAAIGFAAIGVAAGSVGSSSGNDAIVNAQQQRSWLLDGPAFQAAIAARVSNIEEPRSALLDGAAFQAAIAAVLDADRV